MPLTTAAGPISEAQELLRVSLAACTYFRTWAGVSTADEALLRIHHEGPPPPADNADEYGVEELRRLLPFVVLSTDDQQGFRMKHVATDTRFRYHPSGVLIARFERLLPPGLHNDPAEADRRLRNLMGQILETGDNSNPGLADLAGQAGYLAWETVNVAGPFRTPENEIATKLDTQVFYYEFEWGLN